MKLKTFGYGAFIIAAAVALAIGSASPSDAKGKKKMAAPPPPPAPAFCIEPYAPVCAIKGGVQKQTYANRCFAIADGAKVISSGPCKEKKAAHKKTKKNKKTMKKPAAKKTMKKK